MKLNEFPWRLGPKRGLCRWDLTTRDSVRHGTPGAPDAGAGRRGLAEKLSGESEGRRRRPSLIHRLRISVLTEGVNK
jgi:hypothetical protein